MQQAVMTSPGKIEFREIAKPQPKTAEVLVKIEKIGVCGSDIHGSNKSSDNGKEFAAHHPIAKELATDVYFVHPYSPWECGSNENTNGLIRQYFPKTRNLTTVTTQEELVVMDRLNLRPRKMP